MPATLDAAPSSRRVVGQMLRRPQSGMKLDVPELLAHAAGVAKRPTMKGFLMKQGRLNTGSWKRRYFCLRGPSLYYYRCEDPSTCIGLIFVEDASVEAAEFLDLGVPASALAGCGLRVGGAGEGPAGLVVRTCGNRRMVLIAQTPGERDLWCKALRSQACASMSSSERAEMEETLECASTEVSAARLEAELARAESAGLRAQLTSFSVPSSPPFGSSFAVRDDDSDSDAPRTTRSESALQFTLKRSKDSAAEETRDAALALVRESQELRDTLQEKLATLALLQDQTARLEQERDHAVARCQQLLHSRGVALQAPGVASLRAQDPRRSCVTWSAGPVDLRVWVGTWNLNVTEPMSSPEAKGRAPQLLRERFAPQGCDLYLFGVQEAGSENIFHHLEALLSLEGVRRLRLNSPSGGQGSPVAGGEDALWTEDASLYMAPRVEGRGDGSLLSNKWTGLAVFASERLCAHGLRVTATGAHGLDRFSSKGAAAIALSIGNGSGSNATLAFLSSHLEAGTNGDKAERRREQFLELSEKVSGLICAPGLEVTTQFHHIIWVGDLNYRLLEAEGAAGQDGPQQMRPEAVLQAIEAGESRRLFDEHDGLNRARAADEVFSGYCEASPFPDFMPTYKLLEDRPVPDISQRDWTRQQFCTRYKEPFYKGGAVKNRTPGFCDRILYRSQEDTKSLFEPEAVEVPLDIVQEEDADGSALRTPMRARIHNYRSVPGGEGFSSSDHAPVFATFRLRLPGPPLLESAADVAAEVQAGVAREEKDGEVAPTKPRGSRKSSLMQLAQAAEGYSPKLVAADTIAETLGTGPVLITLTDFRVVAGNMQVTPLGLEVNFPAPYETLPDASGAPEADVSPSSGWGWSTGQPCGERTGAIRTILATAAVHDAQRSGSMFPPLVLSWRGAGGGMALQQLHIILRVPLEQAVDTQPQLTRRASTGLSESQTTHVIAQTTISLGPLLEKAAMRADPMDTSGLSGGSSGGSEAAKASGDDGEDDGASESGSSSGLSGNSELFQGVNTFCEEGMDSPKGPRDDTGRQGSLKEGVDSPKGPRDDTGRRGSLKGTAVAPLMRQGAHEVVVGPDGGRHRCQAMCRISVRPAKDHEVLMQMGRADTAGYGGGTPARAGKDARQSAWGGFRSNRQTSRPR